MEITKVFQTKFGKGQGNCTTAALASFFSMSMDDVPDVYSMRIEDWRDNLVDFFLEKGFELIFDTIPPDDQSGIYFVEGLSSRGCRHVVLEKEGTLLHDPHPSGDELVTKDVWWIISPLSRNNLDCEL